MKKRTLLLTASLSLLAIIFLCISSCRFSLKHFSSNWTPATIPEFQDLEKFSYLDSHIDNKSTLPEIMDDFEAMCRIPYETYFDTYRLETNIYENNGEKIFMLTLSHQFQTSWYIEFVDIGVEICYEADAELEEYEFVKFFEGDFEGLLTYLRESDLYQKLVTRKIIDCGPFGILW